VALCNFTPERKDACIRLAEFLSWDRLRRLDLLFAGSLVPKSLP
jgi:hypothetical protein